jgi:elongation factor 1-alpha
MEEGNHVTSSYGHVSERNVVFVGHIDSGKSTLIGHMCKMLAREKGLDVLLPGLNKNLGDVSNEAPWATLKQRAEEIGKASFCYAFAVDVLREERERGVSIHTKTVALRGTWKMNLIDTGGHIDFLRGRALGLCLGETAAVVVVSAAPGEMETQILSDEYYEGGVWSSTKVVSLIANAIQCF